MGSPITFSGFNDIDFNVVLEAIMQQESVPLQTLQTQRSEFQSQSTAYASLATQLGSLETAIAKLSDAEAFGGRAVTNSDTSAVTVPPTSSTPLGTYDVVVNTLARSQVTATNSSHADKDTTTVATGGTLTIGGTAVTISSAVTLQGLADAINATANVGVTAAIVSPSAGAYQLVLTGNDTGAANGFLITNGLTGGSAPVTFIDTDTDGTSGDSPADNAIQATDAQVVVNNITVSSTTNDIESAIPGASLTLLAADPTETITVTVSRDHATTKSQIQDFVAAYSDLVDFIKEQTGDLTDSSQSTIGRDPLVRGLRNALRDALTANYAVGGSFSYLSEVGIGFEADGTLTFTESTFDDAVQQSLADVELLFRGTTGQNGAFTALESLLDSYTEAGGLVAVVQEQIDDRVTRLDTRIIDLEDRLAVRRASLQEEFIAADLAISRLNDQMASISSIGGQFSLF